MFRLITAVLFLRTFAPFTLDWETQSVLTAIFSLNLVLPTCCGHCPWGRRGWFCQSWQKQTLSQWEKSQHPALQRRGPCAPWPAFPGTSCHTCRGWRDREKKRNSVVWEIIFSKVYQWRRNPQTKEGLNSLVVLVGTREIIGFHWVPA